MEKRYTINLDIMQLVKLESILKSHLDYSLQHKDVSDDNGFFGKFYEREAKETSELLGLAEEAFAKREA